MTQEELKLVLEALKWCHGGEPCGTAEAIAVIEKALAQPKQTNIKRHEANVQKFLGATQPKQEPTKAMIDAAERINWSDSDVRGNIVNMWQAMYAVAPPSPQRTWVGLTHEEIDYIYTGIRAVHHDVDSDVLCRAIEAKLKEKNT